MTIRFLADNDFNENIIRGVKGQEPAIDFLRALDAGLSGLTDVQVLTIAANLNRVLVSYDQKTMLIHFAAYIGGHESPGVVIIPQNIPIIQVIEEIILIWSVSEMADWRNRIVIAPL